jgi:uncharacterized membrane protein YkvA (DUF1232 family)
MRASPPPVEQETHLLLFKPCGIAFSPAPFLQSLIVPMKLIRLTPKITEMPALVRTAPAMFRDLFARRYRQIPAATILGGILGLAYLINPFDLIPDVLPIVGIVDDTLIVGIFLTLLGRDVKKYLLWKNPHEPKSAKKA